MALRPRFTSLLLKYLDNHIDIKKLILTVAAILSATSAFAYYGGYADAGLAFFFLVIYLGIIVLSIIMFVKMWKMTDDVKLIRQHLINPNPKLTYLVATGQIEQAQKAALKMLVDKMYPIYFNSNNYDKAESMDKELAKILPQMRRLGLDIPDYATSGEKFIDYMNGITGRHVRYKDANTF